MHIRCPHCDTQLDFAADTSVATTCCPECGKEIENASQSETINHSLNPKEATSVDSPALATTFVPHRASAESPLTDNIEFGDYEILHEIARGGMGVVYKARQKSLNRIVALKMILSGHLASEKDVKRFRSEAEAAAGLDHPNIVPVYEVGEIDDQHFFSMGFVEGESLARKLIDGPLPSKEAAALTKTIAEAVEYSHQKGIVHRDLKPGNVLIDENGQLKVTDFGLAKQIESNSSMTATGQIMGTPSYMAPEQAVGKTDEVGPLSDVYSLGAILYCLLTGRPPFQAANVLDTLKQVVEQEPVSPRVLNPEVDKDLETIILKCLQKESTKRYGSAQELAEELERFQQGIPILARPVGKISRFARWTKRNPLVAGLSGTVAVVLLVGTIVSTYFAVETKAGLSDLQIEKKQSDSNADRATKNAKEAGDAVHKFLETVHNAKLLKEERFKPLLKDLLKDALVFYERFAKDSESHDPEEVANAFGEIGMISFESGDVEKAIKSYLNSIHIREKLVEENPAIRRYQADLAASHSDLGLLRISTGYPYDALLSLRNALEIHGKLVSENPSVGKYQFDLAKNHNQIGNMYRSTVSLVEALWSFREAIKIMEKLVKKYPDVTKHRLILGASHNNIGLLLQDTGKLKEALLAYKMSLDINEKLVEENPAVTEYQDSLANNHHNIGVLHHQARKFVRAILSYSNALEIREKVAMENPTVTEYQNSLAKIHNNMGTFYNDTGKSREALVSYKTSIEIREKLVEENPTVTEYQEYLAGNYNNIGNSYSKSGKSKEALASLKSSLGIRERLVDENPTVTEYQDGLAEILNSMGNLHSTSGKSKEALVSYKTSIEIREKLVEAYPAVTEYQNNIARCHRNAARLYYRIGKLDMAFMSYNKAVEIYEKLVEENPVLTEYRNFLAYNFNSIRLLHRSIRQPKKALLNFNKAIKIQEKLVEENPTVAEYQNAVASSHVNIGTMLQDAGNFPKALMSYNKAIKIQEKLIEQNPTVTDFKNHLANSLNNKGTLFQDTGKLSEALVSFKKSFEIRKKLVEENPSSIGIAIDLGGIYVNTANLERDNKNYKTAMTFYNSGVETLSKVISRNSKHARGRLFLRNAYYGRAKLLEILNRFSDAISNLKKALEYNDDIKQNIYISKKLATVKAKLRKQKNLQQRPGKKKKNTKRDKPLIAPRPKLVGRISRK